MSDKVYSAIVESGTNIVMQFSQGYGTIPTNIDPGYTTYPVTEEEFTAYMAWCVQNNNSEIYVRNPDGTYSAQEKPENPATINKTQMVADGADLIIISSLPPGSKVVVEGIKNTFSVDDGAFEFTYDFPNVFHVVCESQDYQQAVFVITAI